MQPVLSLAQAAFPAFMLFAVAGCARQGGAESAKRPRSGNGQWALTALTGRIVIDCGRKPSFARECGVLPSGRGIRSLAVLLLPLLAACAQPQTQLSTGANSTPSEEGQLNALLAMTPIDRWETGVKRDGQTVLYANAGTVTAARDAVLLLGCTSDEKTVVLMVTPKQRLQVDPSLRPVTITFDGGTPLTQDWQSSSDSYWTGDFDPGFSVLLQSLKTHKEVEFVLGGPNREIDRRRFKLNGADQAIEHVISNCAKKV